MCIYLGEVQGLNYDSQDHIIPAGLGGIQKLPINYVSREFNNLSSKFEKALLRSSILSLPRQILGPGKRGSLNPQRATKSRVNVFSQYPDNGSFSLGYIKNGKPYEIPHMYLNSQTGEVRIAMDKETTDSDLQLFKQKLNEFNSLRIRLIKFPSLESNIFLLGIKSDVETNYDCFIASKDGKTNPFTSKALSEAAKLIESRDTFSGSAKYRIITHQDAVINDDYYKCCAKIAFNCLAHIKGKAFVLDEKFDPLRSWVVTGGENSFVDLLPNHQNSLEGIFPPDSHQVLITKSDNGLIADVCFYNHFHNLVRLAGNFPDAFNLNGIVCDWKGKKEFGLYNYLGEYPKNASI